MNEQSAEIDSRELWEPGAWSPSIFVVCDCPRVVKDSCLTTVLEFSSVFNSRSSKKKERSSSDLAVGEHLVVGEKRSPFRLESHLCYRIHFNQG
jgi:hypothetical protein